MRGWAQELVVPEVCVNYSTGVMKVLTSSDTKDDQTRVKRLVRKGLLGIEEVGDGVAFELK